MGKSAIPYLTDVWNVVTGCSGKGCQAHCYAREMVRRFPAIHGWETLAAYPEYPVKSRPLSFSEVHFHPSRLSEPMKRKKPTVYGCGFFGDLFDEQVKFEWIHEIMSVIVRSMHHTYIFLTKQPQNMVRWFERQPPGRLIPDNIYWGTTVCTQPEADEKIPELLKVPGRKWLSLEPLLGPVDLDSYLLQWKCPECGSWQYGSSFCDSCEKEQWENLGNHEERKISLVVAGGESGPKRRPMPLEWAYSVVSQCKAAGVPCFVKQLDINGKVSTNPEEWPEELRVRELPWRAPHDRRME